MKYYEWLGNAEAIDVDFPEDEYQGWWMVEGRPVPEWDSSLQAIYHADEPISFHYGWADNAWPVFSPEMRSLLERAAPGLVQFLPFTLVVENTSREVGGFCVGQILRLVDCLDRKRTKVRDSWKPINPCGDFGVYRPFFLKGQLIGDNKLFRIKGKSGTIVARDDLKKAIEGAGFKRQRFDEIEVD